VAQTHRHHDPGKIILDLALSLAVDARRWEPKRFSLRLFSIAGRIARHSRKMRLHLSERASWSGLIAAALTRLETLPAPT
jgi:hypothetical protein